jgi:hypothetical protein
MSKVYWVFLALLIILHVVHIHIVFTFNKHQPRSIATRLPNLECSLD